LLNEIKIGRTEREKAGSIIEEELRDERERLIRELNDAKASIERMRGQNSELQDKVHDITRLNSENIRKWETTKGDEEVRNKLKRQRSEEVILTVDKSVDNITIMKEK
jgi:signal transduction histidine kinase